jgi:hypothetical protein
MTTETSELWRSLSSTLFANVDDAFVAQFRRPGGANNRLGAWDPVDRTMRYFKFLLYTVAERQPDLFFSLYSTLGCVDIGAPIFVKMRSCAINIDYLLSVQEYLFLESTAVFSTTRSIIEIGAGFGRTCHTLLTLVEQIERYTIIDLPNVLELSRRVLSQAVPQHINKIRFIDATDNKAWRGLAADLAINIDSFQEMLPATIDSYMKELIASCSSFYVKNPVAKYDPACIGISVENPESFQDVFSLGYCRDVIDIFDDAALAKARSIYLEAYRPGADWRCVAQEPMAIFPYYLHALYRRESPSTI